ncbi:hypothetical protein OSH11_17175 [Kaistia dalseonensis]|uniref:Uncharacterized protein n=1 Tax=Kaistia dalseonensis TaxID=410840 RepID=A0ABU0HB20_9HYPH|nr:hypothetical protein [Kaistia dalseonensis]MCX5496442.1 hypothetical protein [Kaistia dalseonensis]MDQ0439063.1 hypothetical protein [Kaistia dalseonensis]
MTPEHEAALLIGIASRGIGAAVAERIIRLNPHWERGQIVRGWHPAPTASSFRFERGAVSIPDFDRKWGRGAARRLPRSAFISRGGKRRAIRFDAFALGPAGFKN